MLINIEVDVFDDPEYCNDEYDKNNKCRHLFRGQCDILFVNLKHDFPDAGFYDKYEKCRQCKEAWRRKKKIDKSPLSLNL